ncbi:MAG: hypothetical protein ACFCGT_23290 [Sandaracinaceae bacterium]
MGGGAIGYIWAMVGCGSIVALVAVCTGILYAVARAQRDREPKGQARAIGSSSRGEPDAPPD